jgi:hypothetical protein
MNKYAKRLKALKLIQELKRKALLQVELLNALEASVKSEAKRELNKELTNEETKVR